MGLLSTFTAVPVACSTACLPHPRRVALAADGAPTTSPPSYPYSYSLSTPSSRPPRRLRRAVVNNGPTSTPPRTRLYPEASLSRDRYIAAADYRSMRSPQGRRPNGKGTRHKAPYGTITYTNLVGNAMAWGISGAGGAVGRWDGGLRPDTRTRVQSAGEGRGGSGSGSGGGGGGGGDEGDGDDGPAGRPLLTRYPDWSAGGVLRLLDWLGTALFGISGSVVATSSGLDLLGATLVGVVTAIGGGSIRDIIIGNRAVFWLAGEFEYFLIAASAAASTRLFGSTLSEKWPSGSPVASAFQWVMKWGDAVAVGTFAIIGAHNGLRLGSPWPACLLFGIITATFGGVVRDVVCNRPVRIMHSNQEMYATVALSSAGGYTAATRLCLPPPVRVATGLGVALAGRYLATSRDPQVLRHLVP